MKSVINNIPFFILLFILLIAELIIWPFGEFPLNDDFAYARSVFIWDQTNMFQLGSWPAMTLFSHALLGLLFVKVFGFSYVALRLANMALCLVTLFVLNKYFKKSQTPRMAAILCAIIVFNPYYLNLFNSFMTDLTFVNFTILGFYFLNEYFKTGKIFQLVLFSLFGLLAILVRQLGVALFIAFLLVETVRYFRFKEIRRVYLAIFSMILSLVMVYVYESFLVQQLNENAAYKGIFFRRPESIFNGDLLWQIISKALLLLKFAGSFFVLILPFYWDWFKNRWQESNKFYVALNLLMGTLLFIFINHQPITGHLVINFGLGVESTIDRLYIGSNTDAGAHNVLYYALMMVFSVGYFFGLLFFSVIDWSKVVYLNSSVLFLMIAVFLYFVLIGIAETSFDRYCLFPAVMIILAIVHLKVTSNRMIIKTSFFVGIILASYSVLGNKDYFSKARKKEEIARELALKEGVASDQICIDAEHQLWDGTLNDYNWVNWDHFNEKKFIISRGLIDGFQIYKRYPFQKFMPYEKDTLFVLKNSRE